MPSDSGNMPRVVTRNNDKCLTLHHRDFRWLRLVLVCAHVCVGYEHTLASSQWEKPCQFSSHFQRTISDFPEMMVSRSSRVLSLSNRIERDLIDSMIRFKRKHIYVCALNRYMCVRLIVPGVKNRVLCEFG